MSETLEQNYHGLPVLTDEEVSWLMAEQSSLVANTASDPDFIAHNVIRNNKYIGLILAHDIDEWTDHRVPEGVIDEEINDYTYGIHAGYLFFIGVFTFVKFNRSGYDDFDQFLLEAPSTGELPNIDEKVLDRVRLVRSGEAIMDSFQRDDWESSSYLAIDDSYNYIQEAIPFETLMLKEIEDIEGFLGYNGGDGDEVKQHILGFKHGVMNAIEMYLQAMEEQVGAKIDQPD